MFDVSLFEILVGKILERLIEFISILLMPLSQIEFKGATSAINYFMDILDGIAFFLPFETIQGILAITLGLFMFRLVIAFLRALWSLIPLL